MLKILLLAFASCFALSVQAHPVAFEGAWGVMSYNDEKENELTATYSFKSYFASGVSYFKFDQLKMDATLARANFLVKRWNNEDSQGNFYLSGAYGVERSWDESKGLGLGQADLDWESRKYYVAAQYMQFFRDATGGVREDIQQSKLRAGFAPYLADFNDLNTWLILQVKKENEEDLQTTQFVRLFYRNVLVELGVTFGGGWAFNYMAHF